MHTKPESLGDIIKYYRERSDYTVEELANKIGITERYLYRIENEGKIPSYNILYRIIRYLSISPDIIFYPEKRNNNLSKTSIFQLLSECNEHEISIVEYFIKCIKKLN